MYDYITLPYGDGFYENRFQSRFTGNPKMAIQVETPRVPNFNSLIRQQQKTRKNNLLTLNNNLDTYRSIAPNFPPPPPPIIQPHIDLEIQGYFLIKTK